MKPRERNRQEMNDRPWFMKRRIFIVLLFLIFAAVFGTAHYIAVSHYRLIVADAAESNKKTANLVAQIILERQEAAIRILQSYAGRAALVGAAKRKDVNAAVKRFIDMKMRDVDIDRVFITDKAGMLWANYPIFREGHGKSFSGIDWHQGISREWKPYASNVFKKVAGDKALAVAVVVPVFDEKNMVVGILGQFQNVASLAGELDKIKFDPGTKITLTDRIGQIIFSNKYPYKKEIAKYPYEGLIKEAKRGLPAEFEIPDPAGGGSTVLVAVAPIKETGWSVIIEREKNEVLKSEQEHIIYFVAFTILIFLFLAISLAYFRKAYLQRKTFELLAAEKKALESEAQYRSIFDNAIVGIFQGSSDGQFIKVNPALAHIHGYESPEEMVVLINDMGQLYVNLEERKKYLTLLKEKDVVTGFEVQFYRKDRSIVWASMFVHTIRDKDGKIHHYAGIIEDITARKQAEQALEQSIERLRKTVGSIIDVIVLAVETRDPYTAGHQKRVANLARAIATEMGLSGELVEGVRLAGVIHDLGKIAIPAEILTTPRKLTDIEYGLVKTHPEIGYNIVKDVDFSTPVAQILLQHHERLDGSGYPQGLKGEDILLEARIIAVADVVEAVASNRPYRPALGIDVALEEIEKDKGILYDSEAVDVCLKLFREKGFRFE